MKSKINGQEFAVKFVEKSKDNNDIQEKAIKRKKP